MKHYTRREALEKLSPAVLLSLGLWPGALRAAATGGESFRFIVVNDLHYMTEECGHWLERMTSQMKSHGDIDLCIVAGDMTDYGKPEHHGAVREILKTLKMPLHVVIGRPTKRRILRASTTLSRTATGNSSGWIPVRA